MDKLTRIASALERIAEALERQNEVVNITDKYTGCEFMPVYQNDPIIITAKQAKEMQDKIFKEAMMSDDKTADTCRAKFDEMPNFGKRPDDRYLTKEEAHALNRAVKRSTIKVHEGKIEK